MNLEKTGTNSKEPPHDCSDCRYHDKSQRASQNNSTSEQCVTASKAVTDSTRSRFQEDTDEIDKVNEGR
jgi:hypothetical protein